MRGWSNTLEHEWAVLHIDRAKEGSKGYAEELRNMNETYTVAWQTLEQYGGGEQINWSLSTVLFTTLRRQLLANHCPDCRSLVSHHCWPAAAGQRCGCHLLSLVSQRSRAQATHWC